MKDIDYSLIISILALIVTIYTYIKHDRKIKEQEQLINKHQIAKIEEEKTQLKQAIVRASLIPGNKGSRILRVYNKGKASATNVRLIINDEPNYLYATNPFPFPLLNESENVDLNISLHNGTPDNISFIILWNDEYKEDNAHSQTVQLR